MTLAFVKGPDPSFCKLSFSLEYFRWSPLLRARRTSRGGGRGLPSGHQAAACLGPEGLGSVMIWFNGGQQLPPNEGRIFPCDWLKLGGDTWKRCDPLFPGASPSVDAESCYDRDVPVRCYSACVLRVSRRRFSAERGFSFPAPPPSYLRTDVCPVRSFRVSHCGPSVAGSDARTRPASAAGRRSVVSPGPSRCVLIHRRAVLALGHDRCWGSPRRSPGTRRCPAKP